jgi:hypothetical protein
MRITNEVLEGYLNCKTKGGLKLAGEAGIRSDYEAMTTAASQVSRESALANLVSRFSEADACRGVRVTATTLSPLLDDPRGRALCHRQGQDPRRGRYDGTWVLRTNTELPGRLPTPGMWVLSKKL